MIEDLSKPITSLDLPDYGQRATVDLTPRNGLSHVLGERQPPLWHKTIPALLAEAVTCFGEREAVVFRHKISVGVTMNWRGRLMRWQQDCLPPDLKRVSGLAFGRRIGLSGLCCNMPVRVSG